jgi:hypothetical protein
MLQNLTNRKNMKHLIIFILTIFLPSFSYGQNVTELYNQKNFQELIKLDGKTDNLTADELYMVGFAFFQNGER